MIVCPKKLLPTLSHLCEIAVCRSTINAGSDRWPVRLQTRAVVISTETESGFITEDDTSPVCHTPSCSRSAKIQSTLPMMWGQWIKVQEETGAAGAQWSRYGIMAELEPYTTKDPPCRGAMHVKSVDSLNILQLVWCGSLEREVSALVSSSSLDYGSKLRGPSPKALVYLSSATLIFTHALKRKLIIEDEKYICDGSIHDPSTNPLGESLSYQFALFTTNPSEEENRDIQIN
ncbi:hypothetical protein TNCV_3030421 [Trichonephila clavipes]|nr:hypothetical protein TNCV_3030421 [Trichonephila clavipes]